MTESAATAADEADVEISPLADYLLNRDEGDEGLDAARDVLARFFPDMTWALEFDTNVYGHGAHGNLWQREIRGFRGWLEARGIVDEAGYASLVGPVQFRSAQATLRSIFGDQPVRSNRGWRVRIVGFPAVSWVVIGLSHNYAGDQAQSRLMEASHRLRRVALRVLQDDPEAHDALGRFRQVEAADWDSRGLFEGEPRTTIGDFDISEYDGGAGAELRMIRNTTVKKDLATFLGLQSMSRAAFEERGAAVLLKARTIARSLGRDRG